MEVLESLLFGIEPATALVIGVGALLLSPVVGAVESAVTHPGQEASAESGGNSVSQSSYSAADTPRDFAKNAVVWGIGIVEGVQSSLAEVSESVQDLIAEAKAEYEAKKAEQPAPEASKPPRSIDIE